METRCCLGCKKSFHPRPQCPVQKYCSSRSCQQARKRRWHRHKLKTDSAYSENQKAAQQRWSGLHPGYWRDYRAVHADYVARNREQQRQRDHASHLAKMDTSISETSIPSGRYRLTPVHTSDLAKIGLHSHPPRHVQTWRMNKSSDHIMETDIHCLDLRFATSTRRQSPQMVNAIMHSIEQKK